MTPLGITILASGSAGNATLVHTRSEAVLIDAGLSAREFFRRLKAVQFDPALIRAIVVTHEHTDHIRGLRKCAADLGVPVYATRLCADWLRAHEPDLGTLVRFEAGSCFDIGELTLTSFPIRHDAVDPVGYTVSAGEFKIGVATDLGTPSLTTDYNLRNCNTLVLESNHDLGMLAASSRPWSLKQRILGPIGHLSNPTACELLGRLLTPQTHHLILAHISRECNTYDLALHTAEAELQSLGRTDIRVCALHQEEPSELFTLEEAGDE